MCNCKKNVRKEPEVITSTPASINVPQTPEELLAQELKEWNGGPQIEEKND